MHVCYSSYYHNYPVSAFYMLRYYTSQTGSGMLFKRRYLHTLVCLSDYSGSVVGKGDTLL